MRFLRSGVEAEIFWNGINFSSNSEAIAAKNSSTSIQNGLQYVKRLVGFSGGGYPNSDHDVVFYCIHINSCFATGRGCFSEFCCWSHPCCRCPTISRNQPHILHVIIFEFSCNRQLRASCSRSWSGRPSHPLTAWSASPLVLASDCFYWTVLRLE